METEIDPYHIEILTILNSFGSAFSIEIIVGSIVLLFLLISSAMVSGSEVAFFSLSPMEITSIKKSNSRICRIIIRLLDAPEKLLATILVANNFINVAIVIITAFITRHKLSFLVQVVIITFILLLFGEIIPKVYANRFSLKFTKLMAVPLSVFERIFRPLNVLLTSSSSFVHKRLAKKRKNISIDELSNALELTESNIVEDRNILKGIVKFGNIDVNEIMTSRVDIVAIDIHNDYSKLLDLVVNSGYSRIPVYEETEDTIKGILYIKDLLPFINNDSNFNWQKLIRTPYFVPESKKIDDLLKEFQDNKIHMAIVVNEYGGTSGLITLEDILEEIVGEIEDESDEIENIYTKIDNNNYIFDGKILLNDFYKILEINEDFFREVKGDADTLAGLILELRGEIPGKNDILKYKNFEFKILNVSNRRIVKIKVTVKKIK